MNQHLRDQLERYADVLLHIGVNLQPGQPLRIGAELPHAEFARILTEKAYQAGASFVAIDWIDTPSTRARMVYSQPQYLDYFPEYEVARHQQFIQETWARLALTGDAFPDIFDDVPPAVMRQLAVQRSRKLKFFSDVQMANGLQWCVAAAPTEAWAKRIFPDLTTKQAIDRLWELIFATVRIDQPDPVAAWRAHDQHLKSVVTFMAQNQVRSIRYFDPAPGPDGKPSTDLTVGLTDHPVWIAASSSTPAGVTFVPNMPTEEVFTTPHNQRTEGWVRTSKPSFPLERRVENALFRFEQGEVVEATAEHGADVIEQFIQIPGAKRLGEVSLVDVRSPINQSGVLFFDTLFDENAVCHIAFGKAYPEGCEGASAMNDEERTAHGVNLSDTHVDFMIGTPTMHVYGVCADGRQVTIMENGEFSAVIVG